jgi:CheY-like chemotaxis protein
LSARNANQGIRLARSFLPDVILMDINLPDISGSSALKILADDPATAHIPVLALSANANPGDIERVCWQASSVISPSRSNPCSQHPDRRRSGGQYPCSSNC